MKRYPNARLYVELIHAISLSRHRKYQVHKSNVLLTRSANCIVHYLILQSRGMFSPLHNSLKKRKTPFAMQ